MDLCYYYCCYKYLLVHTHHWNLEEVNNPKHLLKLVYSFEIKKILILQRLHPAVYFNPTYSS